MSLPGAPTFPVTRFDEFASKQSHPIVAHAMISSRGRSRWLVAQTALRLSNALITSVARRDQLVLRP